MTSISTFEVLNYVERMGTEKPLPNPFQKFDATRGEKGVYTALYFVQRNKEHFVHVPGSFTTPELAFKALAFETYTHVNKMRSLHRQMPIPIEVSDDPVETSLRIREAFRDPDCREVTGFRWWEEYHGDIRFVPIP